MIILIIVASLMIAGCSLEKTKIVTQKYALTDIQSHSTPNDCWLAIHGKVYDITNYVSSHPGGPSIEEGCGKDATELFEKRPSSGTPHPQGARDKLNKFEVGTLV